MQLSGQPPKIVLPLANDSTARAAIPATVNSPGRATQQQGFPPLTRTDPLAGGIPPDGTDMNGMLYLISAVTRWATAGGGFTYDSTFANDTNVGGYPKGAAVLNSDGTGEWRNLADGNTSNPDTGGTNWMQTWLSGSVGTSGYLVLPIMDGTTPRRIILQWTKTANIPPASTIAAWTYPTAFPNGVIGFFGMMNGLSAGTLEVTTFSNTSATFGNGTAGSASLPAYVFVLGY